MSQKGNSFPINCLELHLFILMKILNQTYVIKSNDNVSITLKSPTLSMILEEMDQIIFFLWKSSFCHISTLILAGLCFSIMFLDTGGHCVYETLARLRQRMKMTLDWRFSSFSAHPCVLTCSWSRHWTTQNTTEPVWCPGCLFYCHDLGINVWVNGESGCH